MSSEFLTCEAALKFFSDDPLFPFGGSDYPTIDDMLRAISPENQNPHNGFESHLESLSLCQPNNLQPLPANAAGFSLPDGLLQTFSAGCDQFVSQSYSDESLTSRFLLQRSRSSGCFGENPSPAVAAQSALLDCFPNSPDFQRQGMGCSSPDSSLLRRVCSTGDLQSPEMAVDGPLMDESSFKVGRYSAEQRKERILKYRAKRNQRNFNKTIKYACRKTLADNRPRIRGRFARNDDAGDVAKAASSSATTDDDDDDFWIGMRDEACGATVWGGPRPLVTSCGQARFQLYR